MNKIYIGIDPGKEGYICTMFPDGRTEHLSIIENDKRTIVRYLANLNKLYGFPAVAAIEEVHAIRGSSAKSTFSFGEIFGFLQGAVIGAGIPYHLVPPKTWQGEIWVNDDRVNRYNRDGKKMIDTKGTSSNAALRLFPDMDFRRTEKCKNLDDNKVDATLICEYARRKNL